MFTLVLSLTIARQSLSGAGRSSDTLSVESESQVWMVDTVMDRGDHVSDDSNIVRMSGGDGISHVVVESSVVNKTSVVEGVSLSLTLAVHVVVVEGMRVDSSYMLHTSMDNRSYRSYTVDRVDTSYMMDPM